MVLSIADDSVDGLSSFRGGRWKYILKLKKKKNTRIPGFSGLCFGSRGQGGMCVRSYRGE